MNFLIIDQESINNQKELFSSKTVEVHYKHFYKKYIDEFILWTKQLKLEDYGITTLEELLIKYDQLPKQYQNILKNYAFEAYNHYFFFKSFKKNIKLKNTLLLEKIEYKFESLENFKTLLIESSKHQFFNGWLWVSIDKSNELVIDIYNGVENPLSDGFTPLFCFDLWEHSYFLEYKEDKKMYISKLFDNINWDFVEEMFIKKISIK